MERELKRGRREVTCEKRNSADRLNLNQFVLCWPKIQPVSLCGFFQAFHKGFNAVWTKLLSMPHSRPKRTWVELEPCPQDLYVLGGELLKEGSFRILHSVGHQPPLDTQQFAKRIPKLPAHPLLAAGFEHVSDVDRVEL